MHPHRLVLVFARQPRDEQRAKPLVRRARPRAVEALHRALLVRALACARASGAAVRLVTTGDGAAPFAGDVQITRQIAGSFAERLERAVADAFADGWREVVVIGGDAAELDASHLRAAFAALATGAGRRAVLGPALDGGYYLLGLNAFEPAALRDIPLGTADAFAATARALDGAGFTLAVLPPLADVDDAADVRALAFASSRARLRRLARLARLVLAPRALPRQCRRAAPPARPRRVLSLRGPPGALPICH